MHSLTRSLCVIAFFTAVVSLGAAQSGPIEYIYDRAGRLIAVIHPSGDAAVYTYDAVGNLLSIARRTVSDLSVIEFTPHGGPVGTTVTIHGTGFSATALDNTVQFNGTTATVASASTNTLVVSVPSGASTGPISVTTNQVTAVSADAFTVGASAPAISSFTPTVGVAGVQVTISGTNFDPVQTNNRVRLGAAGSTLVSTTSTDIAATVPSLTGSGRLVVTTPFGQAVSGDYFFVAPSPYTASDVAFTGVLAVSQATSVPISTAGKIGLAVFDSSQGQRVSVKVVPGPLAVVSISRPNGSMIVSRSPGIFTALVEPGVLPAAGTYTINVDPAGTATGTTTLTLYEVPPDLTGELVPGTAQTASLATPGQNAKYTFSASANQRISLKVNASAPSGNVKILRPDDTVLASTTSGVTVGFIDTTTLQSGGTYSTFIDPLEANTGSVTVTLYDVPADVTGTISPGGSPVTASLSTPGQNGLLTFSGTSGQRVSMRVDHSAPAGVVAVRKPDDSTLASVSSGALAVFMEPQSLPTTDTYSIKIDPNSANTGNVTTTLYDVPADVSGTITVGGPSVGVTITGPGQNGSLTFSGTSGQQVTVGLTNNTMGMVTVKLLKPDGSQLTSTSSLFSSFNLSTQTLPVAGTYTIVVDPSQWNTGSITVAVTNP